jgi:hypothetical protein
VPVLKEQQELSSSALAVKLPPNNGLSAGNDIPPPSITAAVTAASALDINFFFITTSPFN